MVWEWTGLSATVSGQCVLGMSISDIENNLDK